MPQNPISRPVIAIGNTKSAKSFPVPHFSDEYEKFNEFDEENAVEEVEFTTEELLNEMRSDKKPQRPKVDLATGGEIDDKLTDKTKAVGSNKWSDIVAGATLAAVMWNIKSRRR